MANEMTNEQMNEKIEQMNEKIKKHCEQFEDCFDCRMHTSNVRKMCHKHQWYIRDYLYDDEALMQIVDEINKVQ